MNKTPYVLSIELYSHLDVATTAQSPNPDTGKNFNQDHDSLIIPLIFNLDNTSPSPSPAPGDSTTPGLNPVTGDNITLSPILAKDKD